MTRVNLRSALERIRDDRGDRHVVVTTMGAAREWMALGPLHPLDFVLVPSSMGQATSVGLGLALARPDLRVIVVNGDGSMLMNLGSLVTMAAERPANLAVVIVENGVYEVTGSQPTPGVAARTDLGAVATAAGWEHVIRCVTEDDWHQSLDQLMNARGPRMFVLEAAPQTGGAGPRSPGKAGVRAAEFAAALASRPTA